MIVPYLLRLLCLCLVTFFLVNALLGLTASFASRIVIRLAETVRPRTASHFLFVLRLLPFALGVIAVLGLCVPSYLWLEPQATSERAGWVCLILAFFGAVVWTLSIARAVRAFAASAHSSRMWLRAGREARLPGQSSNAVIVEKESPLLALAGVYRPRMMISEGVLRALSADQLAVALHHENAHRASRDNLKRLLLLLAPASIPFVTSFSLLDRAWTKFTEWAADDEAVHGDSCRALSLAEALLRVARMGAGPPLSFLDTPLVAADRDLSARVDRLLRIELTGPVPPSRRQPLTLRAGLGLGACTAILLAWPPILSFVHRLLELVLH
jgi:Zn-dependent protease with chaperone function